MGSGITHAGDAPGQPDLPLPATGGAQVRMHFKQARNNGLVGSIDHPLRPVLPERFEGFDPIALDDDVDIRAVIVQPAVVDPSGAQHPALTGDVRCPWERWRDIARRTTPAVQPAQPATGGVYERLPVRALRRLVGEFLRQLHRRFRRLAGSIEFESPQYAILHIGHRSPVRRQHRIQQ